MKGRTLIAANKQLFVDLLPFTSGEGDEATSPSFAIRYAAIEGSSSSPEALIASLLPTSGMQRDKFTNGNQAPDCRQMVL